ncbi:alpha-N-arabinofuranosidase [Ornithinimicrobium pekingense]|uniref:non-reducing end alpha-L-arabinofuranosidase n=1 Tax=Ornithinimicrobium pekingense TaxID=384677 RepID=A0ABQ2FCY5_9MICO|nr:alpha-N-arabinofuranosidase [Ornithinimicrobium pekingense]GGK80063.1 alpha-N-arabinofuranosidase [Ornithinimicrobium pekingense]
MQQARAAVDPAFVVAPVGRRLFGSFVEHMGRCVYTGIYEPGHPSADDDGFRGDVLDLVRELGVTTVRYPGGNFVSGYRWEDGVGPAERRPTRLDPAWRTVETNAFGLDEFVRWAARAGVEPMMAVNLGTRGVQEALDLLEYANHPGGTTLSDLRVAHGSPQPHGIRLWCLGNEMDGPWQLGHKTAQEYGRLAAETARAMRQLDPDLELVACGSSSRDMPTFGAWEATVLEHAHDVVDYVSAHAYYQLHGDDRASFLASSVDMDRFIDQVVATVDHVGARLGSDRRIDISFDEWNVWYLQEWQAQEVAPTSEWQVAPRRSEDAYTVLDAVVVGSLLITLLRHADRVTAASQAQLVNTLSLIRTEPGGPAWRQATFHPFALTARHATGTVLDLRLTAPALTTQRYGEVPVLDAVATHDVDERRLTVLVVNRHPSEPVALTTGLRGFGGGTLLEAVVLTDDDLTATNTQDDPHRVEPREHPHAAVVDGELVAQLPPASWSMFVLQVDG